MNDQFFFKEIPFTESVLRVVDLFIESVFGFISLLIRL